MDARENMGFDEVLMEEEKTEDAKKIVDFTAVAPKRRPYSVWEVGGTEYKLRLTGSVIDKLEQKYKANLLNVLAADGLPPLSVMLTVIQAAMQQHHHGIKYHDVLSMFDKYVDEGGDQTMLYANVVMDLLEVSGFFTASEAEVLKENLKELDTNI